MNCSLHSRSFFLTLTLLGLFFTLQGQKVMQDHFIRQFREAEKVLKEVDYPKGEEIIQNIQDQAIAAGDSHVILRTHIAFLNIYLQEEVKADSNLDIMWPLMTCRADAHDMLEYYVGR